MKKLTYAVFLGFLALNTNLSAINEKVPKTEKTKFNKKDYAKVGAASLGFLLFTAAALTPPVAIRRSANLPDWALIPIWTLSIPIYQINILLRGKKSEEDLILREKKSKEDLKSVMAIAGTLSGIIAYQLAIYIYKKISSLRKNELSQPKDESKQENDRNEEEVICEILERLEQC